MTPVEQVAALNEIADSCHLSRNTFDVWGDDDFRFKPSPAARYEDIDCALGKLKKVKGLDRIGFVGNEALAKEKK